MIDFSCFFFLKCVLFYISNDEICFSWSILDDLLNFLVMVPWCTAYTVSGSLSYIHPKT